MAAAAALHALGHGHRLLVDGGHRFHRRPGHRVLAFLELLARVLDGNGAQVSGVGIFASAAFWNPSCSLPWQASQLTPSVACLLSFQSFTTFGVAFKWQSMHFAAARAAPYEEFRHAVLRHVVLRTPAAKNRTANSKFCKEFRMGTSTTWATSLRE